jgi:prepilin-type N-terminal cleavage/methylation domain-containing protein
MNRKVAAVPRENTGFSLLEMLLVVSIVGIIAGIAIPQAFTAVKAYRLHSDASAIATQLNVTRFRSTSQYAPYRLNIDVSAGTYSMERLCGGTASSVDSNCSGTSAAYQPFSTPQIESGTLYLGTGDSFTTTNPGSTVYPGTITGGSASTQFYFNTRGMPVDNTGNPVANGGAVIYLHNQTNLNDAVVVSVGGRISVYNWVPSTSAWTAR